MQRKYAKDGLVAISVSLDDPADEAARARALKFLESKGATFTNLLLNEEPEAWQDKLSISGPPCLYFFDRANRWVKKVGENDTRDPAAEDRLVEQLLAEKTE
jgi:hypothetical protein